MHYFFDESGDFVNGENVSFSLVACLATADKARLDLEREYSAYLLQVYGSAAEVKGKDIGDFERLDICQMIHNFRKHLLVTICVADPKIISHDDIIQFKRRQVEKLSLDKAEYIATEEAKPEYIEEFNRIIRVFEKTKKFPSNHFLQFTITYHLLNEALQRTFMCFHESYRQSDYQEFHFHLDRKNKSGLSPYESFMERYSRIMMWSERAAKSRPPFAIPRTWDNGHTFVNQFMTGTQIHYTELMKNINYVKSHDCLSIQIADIIANTMYRYLLNPNDSIYQKCWNYLAECMGEGPYTARLEYMKLKPESKKRK